MTKIISILTLLILSVSACTTKNKKTREVATANMNQAEKLEFYKQQFEQASEDISLDDFEKFNPLFYYKQDGVYPSFSYNRQDIFILNNYHNFYCTSNVETIQEVTLRRAVFTVKDQLKVIKKLNQVDEYTNCLLYTSPSPRDATLSRMPSSA